MDRWSSARDGASTPGTGTPRTRCSPDDCDRQHADHDHAECVLAPQETAVEEADTGDHEPYLRLRQLLPCNQTLQTHQGRADKDKGDIARVVDLDDRRAIIVENGQPVVADNVLQNGIGCVASNWERK